MTASVPLKAVRVIKAAASAKRPLRIIFILHLWIGVIADEMDVAGAIWRILSRQWKESSTESFQNRPSIGADAHT
jgi:hypothetical protein